MWESPTLWAAVEAVPAGWTDVLATYGPFAPFAALLLVVAQLLWRENRRLTAEVQRITESALERALEGAAVLAEATRVLAEATDALRAMRRTSADDVRQVVRSELRRRP